MARPGIHPRPARGLEDVPRGRHERVHEAEDREDLERRYHAGPARWIERGDQDGGDHEQTERCGQCDGADGAQDAEIRGLQARRLVPHRDVAGKGHLVHGRPECLRWQATPAEGRPVETEGLGAEPAAHDDVVEVRAEQAEKVPGHHVSPEARHLAEPHPREAPERLPRREPPGCHTRDRCACQLSADEGPVTRPAQREADPEEPSVSAAAMATVAFVRKASSLEMTASGATARPLRTKTSARTRMTGTTSCRPKSAPASGAASTARAATPSPVTGVLQAIVAADSRIASFRATNAGRSPESWNGPTKASSRLAIATSPKSCGERTRARSTLLAIAISCVVPKEKAIHAAPRAARRPSAGVTDAGAASRDARRVV